MRGSRRGKSGGRGRKEGGGQSRHRRDSCWRYSRRAYVLPLSFNYRTRTSNPRHYPHRACACITFSAPTEHPEMTVVRIPSVLPVKWCCSAPAELIRDLGTLIILRVHAGTKQTSSRLGPSLVIGHFRLLRTCRICAAPPTRKKVAAEHHLNGNLARRYEAGPSRDSSEERSMHDAPFAAKPELLSRDIVAGGMKSFSS